MIVIHFTSALKKTEAYKNDLYSRRKSLLKIVEVACFLSWCAVHRPVSGKQILEMSRFEVFAEDEFSVSPCSRGSRSGRIVMFMSFSDTSALSDQWSRLRLSFPRCFFAVPSVPMDSFSLVLLTRFIAHLSVSPLHSGLRGKPDACRGSRLLATESAVEPAGASHPPASCYCRTRIDGKW